MFDYKDARTGTDPSSTVRKVLEMRFVAGGDGKDRLARRLGEGEGRFVVGAVKIGWGYRDWAAWTRVVGRRRKKDGRSMGREGIGLARR